VIERPELQRSSGRDAAALLFFAVAAVALSWPMAASLSESVSLRGDYFINLWNFWWMKSSALEAGTSPYFTEALFHPLGVSLARHTLSPLNSFFGAVLSDPLGPNGAFNFLLLIHSALSGWTFYLLASRLTGSRAGALFAGCMWAFNPYHAFYMAQMNVSTLEFLPLAAYFMVSLWRTGSRSAGLGVILSAGLLAATSFYYLVYVAFLGGLLLVGGRSVAPDVSFATGARRLLPFGIASAFLVVLVAWPMVAAILGAEPPVESATAVGDLARQSLRSNDLLGFAWVGPPERLIVSWPTMFGYTALVMLLVGVVALRQRVAWLVAAGAFFLLSLGPELQVGGQVTGVTLPYAWLSELPVFSMLRKPDRFFVLVEFFIALLCAQAWVSISARLRSSVLRRALGCLAVLALCAEFSMAPLRVHVLPVSPLLEDLAATGAKSLVDLPLYGGGPFDARSNHAQTLHGLAIPSGYVTNLALTEEHRNNAAKWKRADALLDRGDASRITSLMESQGVDLVVLHATVPVRRAPSSADGLLVWLPFSLSEAGLVEMRQRGHLEEQLVPLSEWTTRRQTLIDALGEPLVEDERIAVFRRP
jgi:hypothetical protein